MNSSCDYEEYKDDNGQIISRHAHALKCLDDKGDVAYVSLEEAKKFFVRVCVLFIIAMNLMRIYFSRSLSMIFRHLFRQVNTPIYVPMEVYKKSITMINRAFGNVNLGQ